ncbi:hypothetical protein MW887_001755 [Aspergillus wentii]|nr:hypothetical protein MW887_001755 [Aspergillus wentii]
MPASLQDMQSLPMTPSSNTDSTDSSNAQCTSRDVIRCEACPKNFATGMQNVMFTGTLLNVVADAWLRVSKADAVELGKQAAPPSYVTFMAQKSHNPAESWAKWLRGTVRSAVIGGSTEQAGRVQCSDSPNLLSLIKEMEARQRKWHSGKDSHPLHRSPASDQSDGDSCSPSQEADERDLLCLRVVGSAREVIAKFKFEPSEYPDGVIS